MPVLDAGAAMGGGCEITRMNTDHTGTHRARYGSHRLRYFAQAEVLSHHRQHRFPVIRPLMCVHGPALP